MSSKANPKVPPDLLAMQKWFAGIITRPIDHNSKMKPLLSEEEASAYICPSLKLSPVRRIQIYHRQYWWRLFSALHHNFPTLIRLFGFTDFNLSIALPYLTQYPPSHWSLSKLGDQLTTWLKESYFEDDRELVLAAAEVDWAYRTLFLAPSPNHLEPSKSLISEKICLQLHVKLFRFSFDIFSLRETLLKESVDFWMEAPDFPLLQKEREYFYLLYRTPNNDLFYREIAEGQWTLLNSIEKGLTILEACEALEKQGGGACEEAEASLDVWVGEWMRQRLLQRKNP